MKRLLPVLSFAVAAAVAAAAAWLLLRGEPGPPAPPPPPPPAPPQRRRPPGESPPEFAPLPPEPAGAPAENLEPKEAPLPPDAYPWEVPGWWQEIDRRMREKEIVIEDEVLPVREILAFIEKETLFPVRAGPELERWASESRLSLPAVRAPARSVLEAIALRTNLEIVLTADAVLLRQRGRAKEDRVTRAGRVQAAILESRERRAGAREADPAAAEIAAVPVDVALDGVPLREAARVLGERLSIPVYMDAALWALNPSVRIEAGEHPLSKTLDSLAAPMGAAWDATPRRVVLFLPDR